MRSIMSGLSIISHVYYIACDILDLNFHSLLREY